MFDDKVGVEGEVAKGLDLQDKIAFTHNAPIVYSGG